MSTPSPSPTLYIEYPEETVAVNDEPTRFIDLPDNSGKITTFSIVVGSLFIFGIVVFVFKYFLKKDFVKMFIYKDSLEVYAIIAVVFLYMLSFLITEVVYNSSGTDNDYNLLESRRYMDFSLNILLLCVFMFLFSKFGQSFNLEYPARWTIATFIWGIGVIVYTYMVNQNMIDLNNSDSKWPVVLTQIIIILILGLSYVTNPNLFDFDSKIYVSLVFICFLIIFISVVTGFLNMNDSKPTLSAGLILMLYSIFIGSFYNQIEGEFATLYKALVAIMYITSLVLIFMKKPEIDTDFDIEFSNVWSNVQGYNISPIIKNKTKVEWYNTNDVKINALIDLRELNNVDETLIRCGDDWSISYQKSTESIVFTNENNSVRIPIQGNTITINIPSTFNQDLCGQSCRELCDNPICESECNNLKCKPNPRSDQNLIQVLPLTIVVRENNITIYNDTSENQAVESLFVENMKPPSKWSDEVEILRPNVVRNLLVGQANEESFNDLPLIFRIIVIVLLSILSMIILGFFVHPRVREYLGIPGKGWVGNVYDRLFNSLSI